jgi:hypothetical protein
MPACLIAPIRFLQRVIVTLWGNSKAKGHGTATLRFDDVLDAYETLLVMKLSQADNFPRPEE